MIKKIQKGNPLSGEALNKKLYDDAFDVEQLKLETKHVQCFPAGTLVHTDKGLVPIQDIKVGDMVLSRPEWGGRDAPTEYKRVVRAFCSGEDEIVRLTYCREQDYEIQDAPTYVLFMTRNHPLWIEGIKEWKSAINLEPGDNLSCFDSEKDLVVLSVETVFGISQNEVNYGCCSYPSYGQDDGERAEMFINFTKDTYEVELNFSDFNYCDISQNELSDDFKDKAFDAFCNNRLISLPVFNLEIEDNHTYFVGTKGIWVHNDNCFYEYKHHSQLDVTY